MQHDEALEFGNVAVGQSLELSLQLTNTGEKSAQLALSVDSSEFTIDVPTLTLSGGASAQLAVHFSPKALGPRTGTLTIGSSSVDLSGRGVGPQLSVPSEVTLGPLAIVTGQPVDVLASNITLRNSGTSGSLLRLGPARVEGTDELCVGIISGSTCVPWEPPSILDTRTLVEVPLSISPASAGTKRWTVTFPSNDPVNPEVTLEVRALIEAFEPCVFSAPPELVIRDIGVLTLRHEGPGTCLVRNVAPNPPDLLRLEQPVPAPTRLQSNSALTIVVVPQQNAPPSFTAFVRVLAAGTAELNVPVRRESPISECLVIAPSSLDFGTVPRTCNSANRSVALYNVCASPLVIDRVEISGAGEGPGGPNCPGSLPCPEFFIVSGVQDGTTIASGSPQPVTLTTKYRPINYGPDTGAVVVTLSGGIQYVLALQGRGDMHGRNTDTFRQDSRPSSDVLVMVDTSPSFVAKRASVRENLMPLLRAMSSPCIDGRLAFAAADGAPDAGVRLQPNDAGAVWSASLEPNFTERALSAFDSLPVGSEVEACIGPAADLIDDAGVRDGGYLAGVCVTDALESSPNPSAALQRFLQHGRGASWISIAAYTSGICDVEALDDGVHQNLVDTSFGERADICLATWGEDVFPTGTICSYRTTFFLTSRPDGQQLEVRVDGALIPAANWMYDAANNAVTFLPAFVPPPGSTTTISYEPSCTP